MLTSTVRRHRPSWVALVLTCLTCAAVTSVVAAVIPQAGVPMPLTGAVYDVSGAVLPDVKLKLTTPEKLQLEVTTDPAGRYEFPSVGPGKYELEAAIPGFRPLKYELDLRRDRDWTQIITLQVGTVQETITVQAAPIAGATAASLTQGPTPVRVGGNLRPPRKLKDVRPVYPESMRAAGIEGIVTMEAVISSQGAVQSVRVLSGSVHPDLAMAAVDAVRQWRFSPTLLNGKAVDVVMTTTVQFKLGE